MSEQCYTFSNGDGTRVVNLPADMTLRQLMLLGVSRIFLDRGEGKLQGDGFSVLPRICNVCHSCIDTVNLEGMCEKCAEQNKDK